MSKVPILPGEEIMCRAWMHPIVFARGVWSFLLGWAAWHFLPQLPEKYMWAFLMHERFIAGSEWAHYADEGVALLFVVISVKMVVEGLFLFRSTEVVVSNKRILVRFGVWSSTQTELESKKIAGVLVHQSPLGRVLNYGWLRIKGFSGDLIMMPMMASPHKVQQAISNATAILNAQAHADSIVE